MSGRHRKPTTSASKRRQDRLHRRSHRRRKPRPRRPGRRRHRRRMGPGRPLRIRRQLGHQHRQRLPGRPAVLPEHLVGRTAAASTPRPRTWPPRTSRSRSPSACWPPRAVAPGRSAAAACPVRRRATWSTSPQPLDDPDLNGELPPPPPPFDPSRRPPPAPVDALPPRCPRHRRPLRPHPLDAAAAPVDACRPLRMHPPPPRTPR